MKRLVIVALVLFLTPGLYGADKKFHAFQLSYMALDYIDVSMTLYGVKQGYSEANPLAQWYIKSPPLTIAVHTVLNIVIVELSGFIYKRNKKLGWAVIIGLNLAKAYIVYRNFKTLGKL